MRCSAAVRGSISACPGWAASGCAARMSRAAAISSLVNGPGRDCGVLPASTYLQIAATLYISRNTVKTHLHSIYHKLGVTSRAQAIERAADLRIL